VPLQVVHQALHHCRLQPQIACALGLKAAVVERLVDDLERHLFFLVRNAGGEVSWAFPITCEPTPHRLRFSTGEKIFGA